MDMKLLKNLIKKYGVKSWIECGVDVCKVGDKLLKTNTMSRLKYYDDHNWLRFCSKEECITGSCGGIELNNGLIIWYNVI